MFEAGAEDGMPVLDLLQRGVEFPLRFPGEADAEDLADLVRGYPWMTMRSKQWYTKTGRLEISFAKSSIGRRFSDLVSTTRSPVGRPAESKFQICLASLRRPFGSR
jgi:hypothetical protein